MLRREKSPDSIWAPNVSVLTLREVKCKAQMAFYFQCSVHREEEAGFDMNTEWKNKKQDIQDSNSGS